MSVVKFKDLHKENGEAGMSLIAIVVALGMGGILMASLAKMSANSFRSSAKFEQDTERTMLRQQISNRIDCRATLAGLGTPPLSHTGTTSDYITLRRADGSAFLSSSGQKVGKWFARASIEPNPVLGGSMLQVRVAKPKNMTPGGAFATPYNKSNYRVDPLNNTSILSWNHPKSGLIMPGSPICASFFNNGHVQTCPPGQKVTGFDANQKIICGTAAIVNVGCTAPNIMTGIDTAGNPICGPVPTVTVSEGSCNWRKHLDCSNCSVSCPAGEFAKQISSNFSGGGGVIKGNFEMLCCKLILNY